MLDARYRVLVQSTLFDKVKMAVVLFSIDIQPFIFFSQVDTQMVKERDSEIVAWFAWTGRVESKGRPDVPSRETTVVLIARIGFPTWVKGFLTYRLDEKASVFRIVTVKEEIRDVETRLVGNGDLSKGSSSHLAHLVNLVTIAGRFKERSILTGFQ